MFDLSMRLRTMISNWKPNSTVRGSSYYLANSGQSFASCAKSVYSLYGLLGCILNYEAPGLKDPIIQ